MALSATAVMLINYYEYIVFSSSSAIAIEIELAASHVDTKFDYLTPAIQVQYERDDANCSVTNIVLDRTNNDAIVHPYSVSNFTFANFHKRSCSSLDETQLAIRNGTRKWVNGIHESLPPLEKQKFPSYFVPFGCNLQFNSPVEICETLNKYSHFILQGDSLSRQMMQGLLILLTNDLALGGTSKYLAIQDECMCDGQFSEHKLCREYVNYPTGIHVCEASRDIESKSVKISVDLQKKNVGSMLENVNCSGPNERGIIYTLQGGAHHGVNPESFFRARIQPLLNNPNFIKCRELKKLKLIWLSYGAQSRELDDKYPHQSRENGILFNSAIERELKRQIEDVVIVDWLWLTSEAQTSDGFHFLTDVNIVKANLFIHILTQLNKHDSFMQDD